MTHFLELTCWLTWLLIQEKIKQFSIKFKELMALKVCFPNILTHSKKENGINIILAKQTEVTQQKTIILHYGFNITNKKHQYEILKLELLMYVKITPCCQLISHAELLPLHCCRGFILIHVQLCMKTNKFVIVHVLAARSTPALVMGGFSHNSHKIYQLYYSILIIMTLILCTVFPT